MFPPNNNNNNNNNNNKSSFNEILLKFNEEVKSNNRQKEHLAELYTWQRIIASSSGALLTSLIMTPIDVLKIRRQANMRDRKTSKPLSHPSLPTTTTTTKKGVGMRNYNIHEQQTRRKKLKYNSSTIAWHHRTRIASNCNRMHNLLFSQISLFQQNKSHHFHQHPLQQPSFLSRIPLFRTKFTNCHHSSYILTHSNTIDTISSSILPTRSLAANSRLSLIGTFLYIIRHDGILSLYSGMIPTLIMALPATVFYFSTNDLLRKYYGIVDNEPAILEAASIGAMSRIVASSAISPLELIRTKLQSERLPYSKMLLILKSSVRTSGIRSLWNGLVPSLLRDVPFSLLYWGNMELIKNYINSSQEISSDVIQPEVYAISGAISGIIAAIATTPFDVVKTFRQIEMGENEISNSHKSSSSTKELLKSIYKHHGIRGLFAGLVPRIIKVAPACAIMIGSFEYLKLFFRIINTKKLEET
ncbi:hypothetical protein SNEBB_001512 [Seison nebaliae]|nr:hypothetical protein SNEBB_001512 [Seison nebaliae]